MRQGLKNQQALVRDFVDHLSTIFAEIRLKPFIELRSCDALPGAYVTALSALTWEIFYNPTILQKALDLFSHITYDELINFHKDTINHGRNAVFRGKKIFDQAHEILDLGRNNLYTKPFENLVVHNTTGAEWQKERYKFMTPDKLPDLIAHFGALSKPIF
jgi:glutamate--cysteine ligase